MAARHYYVILFYADATLSLHTYFKHMKSVLFWHDLRRMIQTCNPPSSTVYLMFQLRNRGKGLCLDSLGSAYDKKMNIVLRSCDQVNVKVSYHHVLFASIHINQ